MMKHTGETYKCEQCEYTTIYKGYLEQHDASVHKGLRYKCIQCEFQVKVSARLKIRVYG